MPITPNALCFGRDLPASGAPCHIDLASAGLTIQFPDSSYDTIPFGALSIGAGGFDHDQLLLKWMDDGADRTVYVKDPALIRSFREFAPPELVGTLEHTAKQVRRVQLRRSVFLWGTAVSGIALPIIIWFSFDELVGVAVNRIPVTWEQQIGGSARQDVLAGKTVVKDGAAVTAIHEIVRRLTDQIPNSPYRFDVTLVRSEMVNAVALPGGPIVVFSGLVKEAETPEEVAGVLAHEMNHVLLRHGLHATVKNLGMLAVVKIVLGDQEGVIGVMERLGVQLTSLTFSRRMETEADLAGLDLLYRARISPSGMIRFFERLSQTDPHQVDLLSTHPMSAARAERLMSCAAALPPLAPAPIELDWKAIQASL